MPEREDRQDEWLRELLEEYRHGTSEMASLRSELEDIRNGFQELRGAMNTLVETIRGSDGNLGLRGTQALLDNRVKSLEDTVKGIMASGTPHSQAALAILDQQVLRLADGLLELKQQRTESIGRGWQIAGMLGSAALALIGTGVAFAALLLRK